MYYIMKRCFDRQKTKIIFVLAILMFLLSCFTPLIEHVVFGVAFISTFSLVIIKIKKKKPK